jgi:hypothetical protein
LVLSRVCNGTRPCRLGPKRVTFTSGGRRVGTTFGTQAFGAKAHGADSKAVNCGVPTGDHRTAVELEFGFVVALGGGAFLITRLE